MADRTIDAQRASATVGVQLGGACMTLFLALFSESAWADVTT